MDAFDSFRYMSAMPYIRDGYTEAEVRGYHIRRHPYDIIRLVLEGFEIHAYLNHDEPEKQSISVTLMVRPNSIQCKTVYDYDQALLTMDRSGKVTIKQDTYLELFTVKMSLFILGDTSEIKVFLWEKVHEYLLKNTGDIPLLSHFTNTFPMPYNLDNK